ncbi:mitotic checkpoint regulator, MAD2B-interacting-domain-containing protein [Umbelopsis sp. PMI_123]|nr:mitotic checkpoint regulator, MAD2B-interacting-domain-containing protein [Umbelopsis sp. PMI_123]
MPLVANYSSGSESDSDNEPQQASKLQRSFADSLPPPKRKVETTNGKVQIFVDLPKMTNDDYNDNDSEDTTPANKRQKISGGSGGSGLSALLPPPKNPNASLRKEEPSPSTTTKPITTSTTTTFIPPALAKRKAELAAKASEQEDVDKAKLKVSQKTTIESVAGEEETNEDESDDEDAGEVKSFFPLGPNIAQVLTTPTQSQPASVTEPEEEIQQPTDAEGSNITYTAADAYAYYDPNMQYDPAAYQQWYEQQAAYAQYEQQNQNWNAPEEELTGEALERLMGRHGRGMGESVNIKTVNLAEELQNKDGIPTQEPIGLSGSSIKTSSIQKRKSNIMYLAHQAQSRRDILAEQYAQNRKTKREAKMKYDLKAYSKRLLYWFEFWRLYDVNKRYDHS